MTKLILCCACSMALAFFVCGIPFGKILAARMGHVDVTRVGSGNIGMTNVARSVGGKAAAATLALDAGKGLVCMLCARWAMAAICFGGEWAATRAAGPFGLAVTLVYLCCVFGHVYSPYLHFHGGKGISVGFGAALGLCWPIALGLLGVFLVLALPSHYVSLGSIGAAISLPIWGAVFGLSLSSVVVLVVVACAVVWAHRANIGKLARGEERSFSVRHESSDKSGSSSEKDQVPHEDRVGTRQDEERS